MQDDRRGRAPKEGEDPGEVGRGARILLAEDDEAMREMVARVLRGRGFEVIEAVDGIDLLNLAEGTLGGGGGKGETTAPYEVVVSDVKMRHLDGIRALEAARRLGFATSVILMTACGDDETHLRARALGVEELLEKPFEMKDLVRAITRAIEKEPRRKPRVP